MSMLSFGDYTQVKFSFSTLDKYILMELNTKIALEDLKFTFANILKIDFFAKRLLFSVTNKNEKQDLNSQKSLNQQRISKSYQEKDKPLEVLVKFIEEGA